MVNGRSLIGIWYLVLGIWADGPSSVPPTWCHFPHAPKGVPLRFREGFLAFGGISLRSRGRLFGFSSTYRVSAALQEKLSAQLTDEGMFGMAKAIIRKKCSDDLTISPFV